MVRRPYLIRSVVYAGWGYQVLLYVLVLGIWINDSNLRRLHDDWFQTFMRSLLFGSPLAGMAAILVSEGSGHRFRPIARSFHLALSIVLFFLTLILALFNLDFLFR